MASGVGFVENASHVGVAAAANTAKAAIQRKSMVVLLMKLKIMIRCGKLNKKEELHAAKPMVHGAGR